MDTEVLEDELTSVQIITRRSIKLNVITENITHIHILINYEKYKNHISKMSPLTTYLLQTILPSVKIELCQWTSPLAKSPGLSVCKSVSSLLPNQPGCCNKYERVVTY